MDAVLKGFVTNPHIWAVAMAWLVAQLTKMLCAFAATGKIRPGYLIATGGMPSAHSATVAGLATSIGLLEGTSSPLFAVAFVVAGLAMFDASTVRRATGLQARLLNEIIDELFKEHRLSEHKLAELLGHTRLEVVMGMTIGILVGMIVTSVALRRGLPG
ncbi:MAG: divergent PAP2 family protein [Verrucomicrobiae bacterium]|nr:divergent PAP2 family protein [Verrucomicrobiae bacterium]